jgi:hypothetical protein
VDGPVHPPGIVAACHVDWLTVARMAFNILFMRLTGLAPIAPPVLGVPAVLYGGLPGWSLVAVVAASVVLTALPIIVTQVIRLRASSRITRSQDALRVLELEDLPCHPRP